VEFFSTLPVEAKREIQKIQEIQQGNPGKATIFFFAPYFGAQESFKAKFT
jgi:hypothetical protein